MTKEEYKKELEELDKKKRLIQEKYISSNMKYHIGDKVKVISPIKEEIGYISGYEINVYNVEPIICRYKKNGEISKNRIYTYSSYKIEKSKKK